MTHLEKFLLEHVAVNGANMTVLTSYEKVRMELDLCSYKWKEDFEDLHEINSTTLKDITSFMQRRKM